MSAGAGLSWAAILRLGLVQTALGAIVVLMTSTINRVMVVELALPAVVPGLLVALHYAVQIFRPAWGYGSDVGGRRTPWILGGMATLAVGAVGTAAATALAASDRTLGLLFAAVAFALVGLGAGSAGTSVLALLASRVEPRRRAAAASVVWMMMILGFAVSAPIAGRFLDPFSNLRLIEVTVSVAAAALAVSALAIWGLEDGTKARRDANASGRRPSSFLLALSEVWREPAARRFTVFVFISMLAYGAQELLVEPFAGLVYGMAPGATTALAGMQHGGVLIGMLSIAVAASVFGKSTIGSLRIWTAAGCVASAASLAAIAAGGLLHFGPSGFRAAVFALGLSNGVYAVAAIGSMMGLAGAGAQSREGTRMGLWGAAQAIAYALGGVSATFLTDLGRFLGATPLFAYAAVFCAEAALFLIAATLAQARTPQRAAEAPVAIGRPALSMRS